MQPQFQTSFIPKKPIVTGQGLSTPAFVHETNLVSTIATVVLVVTLLTSGGLFAYKTVLNKQITEADQMIQEKRKDIQPDVIQGIIDSSTRMVATKTLLEKHVVVSKLLQLFENLTLRRVRYSELVYSNKNNAPRVTMKGEVQTYNALAQQQEVFLKNDFIKNPQFSEFVLAENGYVNVNFMADVDPSLVSYKKAIEALSPTE